MPLENVHIMEIDRATSRLELVRVNPTRGFMHVELDAQGHWLSSPAQYTWQCGVWYDTGGNEITDLETIPKRFRDEIEANPVTAGQAAGPAVTAVCKFCGEKMNQSDMEQHYIAHVTQAMAQAGKSTPPTTPDKLSEPTAKRDANTHTRG
jgi:hypothetical protein